MSNFPLYDNLLTDLPVEEITSKQKDKIFYVLFSKISSSFYLRSEIIVALNIFS